MGFIRIETVIDVDNKFSCEIESEGLYTINCLPSTNHIKSLDKIHEICIANGLLIILTEDRDFRDGFSDAVPFMKENRKENNINAYDWNGNHLWNIGDLVGDIKMAFAGITYISPMEVERECSMKLYNQSKNLFKCVAGGWTFIIDASKKEIVYKTVGKVK